MDLLGEGVHVVLTASPGIPLEVLAEQCDELLVMPLVIGLPDLNPSPQPPGTHFYPKVSDLYSQISRIRIWIA